MKRNLLILISLLSCWMTMAAGQAYDNVGLTLTKSPVQGMDIWGRTLVSLQNAGTAGVYDYDGNKLTYRGSVKLGSAGADNHCNLASFSNQRYAASDSLPLLYVTRAYASKDSDGMVNVAYVERLNPVTMTSQLVQKICFTGINGAGQYMIDRQNNCLYIFGNTIANGKAGNKHYIYKYPIPPVGPGKPSKVWLSPDSALEGYLWEDTYTGGANPVIQGGAVHDGLMYLPCGYNTTAAPSVLYVWDLVNRRMAAEVQLQTIFKGELEDVSVGYPGRLVLQANTNHIYWIDLDSVMSIKPLVRQWKRSLTTSEVPEGYYYLKARTTGKPVWVWADTLRTGTSATAAVGQVTMQFYNNKGYASVPAPTDARLMFRVMADPDGGDTTFVVRNCGVRATTTLHQFTEGNVWSVIGLATKAQAQNEWSRFCFAPGSSDGWLLAAACGSMTSGKATRLWRKGGAKNGLTTSGITQYYDVYNDFAFEPITDGHIVAYARYCEEVNTDLGLTAGEIPAAGYDAFIDYLSGLDLTYSATADYSALLADVLEHKNAAMTGIATVERDKAATSGACYDLQGRRLPPGARGLVITAGKLVLK